MKSSQKPALSRRQFLAATAAATFSGAARSAANGQNLNPQDKTLIQRPILGIGGHHYQCIHDWLKPPDDILWGYTHDVAQDEQGRIYVTHTVRPGSRKQDAILVFDPEGKFITSWGSEFAGGGHGLDLRREHGREFLYHCDIAHSTVTKTTLEGETVWQMGAPLDAGIYHQGVPFVPTNVAFGPAGDFYVADGYGSNYIHQFHGDARYVRTWGGTGTEPGKFHTPHGIWLDTRLQPAQLVVADRENHRLQYFTPDGAFVRTITTDMRRPCGFHIRGNELLIPDLDSVVTILDRQDNPIVQLGDGYPTHMDGHPRKDFIPGQFIHPHGAKYLHNGDILVAEWVPIGRITLLRRLKG